MDRKGFFPRCATIAAVALLLALPISVSYAAPKDAAKGDAAKKAPAAAVARVDINTASQAELEKLPGVGPAAAKKIIASRPFATVGDLSRAGLPAKTVTKISPLITVGAVPKGVSKTVPSQMPDAKTVVPAAPAKAEKVPAPAMAGKDMVWVNSDTRIFHKPGSRWYGKTKKGSYMKESEAIKSGYREAK